MLKQTKAASPCHAMPTADPSDLRDVYQHRRDGPRCRPISSGKRGEEEKEGRECDPTSSDAGTDERTDHAVEKPSLFVYL